MFSKAILMKCGHYADSIMADVPYDNQLADVAACSFCFKDGQTVNQPACAVAEQQPDLTALPKIKRDRTMALLALAFSVATIIALIASL